MRFRFALLALLLGALCWPGASRVRGGNEPAEAVAGEVPAMLAPLPKDETLRQAYLDAYRILSRENSCSTFYGGPVTSVAVLNRLVASARKGALDAEGVGIRMTGEITYCRDNRTGVRFRLFERVTFNSRGVFYNGHLFRTPRAAGEQTGLPLGARELRVTLLLHELAHLLEGPDGRWLIPNDGGDIRQSTLNTRAVLRRCGGQVGSLKGGGALAASGLAEK